MMSDEVPSQSIVAGMPRVWKSTQSTNKFVLNVDKDVVKLQYLNTREQKVAGRVSKDAQLNRKGDDYVGIFSFSVNCTLPVSDPENEQTKICTFNCPATITA